MDRETILQQVRDLVLNVLSNHEAAVYLFGSWARQEERQSSDIDIAVESAAPLSPAKWVELVTELEDSTIPYHVEVVDMNQAGCELKKAVKKEGIVWKKFSNVSH